ncbi:MAG: enoyl-CoA hydratase [Sciscionella sp.]
MSAQILLEKSDKIAVITVSDPRRRNALTLDLSAELAAAVADCECDTAVHAVIVTGAAPAFCAGADLSALEDSRGAGPRAIYAGFLAVAHCTLPTIAAVNGAAVGAGLNLALAADLRLAARTARFDARFLTLGIHPGGGMTWMAQRLLGQQSASALALFGQVLDAEQAHRIGLVHQVHEPAELLDAAREFAAPTAGAPRDVVLATKASMRITARLGDHEDAVDAELTPQLDSLRAPEFAERLAALRARIGAPGS